MVCLPNCCPMTCPADYVCLMYPTYFAPLMLVVGVAAIAIIGVVFATIDRWKR